MKYKKITIPSKQLVGIKIRTTNKDEVDPARAKIAALAQSYWGNQQFNAIQHRTCPGKTYAIYTDFEHEDKGEYTYFLGEEVDSTADQDHSIFSDQMIHPGCYQKFTTNQGKIPDIILSAWQEIWNMKSNDFLSDRQFSTDFEVYDQRCANPESAIVDICVGIK